MQFTVQEHRISLRPRSHGGRSLKQLILSHSSPEAENVCTQLTFSFLDSPGSKSREQCYLLLVWAFPSDPNQHNPLRHSWRLVSPRYRHISCVIPDLVELTINTVTLLKFSQAKSICRDSNKSLLQVDADIN